MPKYNSASLCLLVIIFFSFQNNVFAQTCVAFDRPTGQFELELVSVVEGSEVAGPTSMAQPPNDSSKWFVLDREGLVSLYSHGTTFSKVQTMVDLTDRVTRTFDGRKWNEMGLLSITVHPDFENNGYIYLYYSTPGPSDTVPLYARLSRFTSNDNGLTIDPNSEQIIIQLDRNKVFHWGGQMMFNPHDGYFHMSIGDGGIRTQSQNYFNLNGSFIRLDMGDGSLPYSIPSDNPFADGVDAAPEIFAKGLRNPWRWSIDSETNRIFLGDVGKSDWEEVNLVESGKNYGWPRREGSQCFEPATGCVTAGLTDPIVEYPHDDTGGVAIIGGYVYRGTAMPDFYGHYIYADALGRIWSFDTNDLSNPEPRVIFEDEPQKYSFAEGADKELYLLATGKIDRLQQGSGTVNNTVPELLSDTGCFESTNPLVPLASSQYYDINSPLWSDGATKQRWMNVPDGETISVTSEHDWDFPIGTVMVKNFSLQDQLVETRLFMRHDDGEWAGYSYEWNEAQTEATIVPTEGKERQVGQQIWEYPSRLQCVQCHTSAVGDTAGPETAQLNMFFRDSSSNALINQLNVIESRFTFENADFSDPTSLPILANMNDSSQTDHWKARSYLYANCAMCHQPGGPGQGPEDFRYNLSDEDINAIDVDPSVDDLGLLGSKLIFPGDSTMSVMALRMHSLDPAIRMPQLASLIEDTQATETIDAWIDAMDDSPASNADSCGEPILNGTLDAGIYLWKDCATNGTWNISAATGNTYKKYIGRILSEDQITLNNTNLTQSNDNITLNSSNTSLDFDLDVRWSFIDSFSFTVNSNSNNCLSFDFPVNTQIWLGASKYKIISNSIDLETLEACDGADVVIDPIGEPDIDRANESGVFVWQELDGSWAVRVTAGGLNSALVATGSISSNMGFSTTSPTSIEANDLFDITNPSLIDFSLKVSTPWLDGFEFTVPNGAELCIDLNDPSINLHIGSNKTQVSTPFNLNSMTDCQTDINIAEGRPSISPDSDEGVFVWSENGVWHVNSTTDSNFYFIQGRVQAYDGLSILDTNAISMEENNGTDFLTIQADNRFLFRMITGDGDQDEFSFEIPNTGESCIDIKIPDPTPVYLGPNRVPISVPYNLTSLVPCSRG